MLVEQAIFASARSGHAEGYHLVARTPGLANSDARELAQWGPSHDSLCDGGPDGLSYNFFGLESGAYCISKTMAAGAEYSGRGGAHVQTQCLVVPPAVLARFSNNPFAVLRAAAATGEFRAGESSAAAQRAGDRQPLRLVGRAAVVEPTLLAHLAIEPGAQVLAALVDQVISGRRLVVVGSSGEKLLAGLINCLPLELRTEMSFSTGLKLSPRRPFRVSAAPSDSAELRRQARALGAEVLVLDKMAPSEIAADSWAWIVEVALQESKFTLLAAEIARCHTLAPIAAAQTGLPPLDEATLPETADVAPAPPGQRAEFSGGRFGRADGSHRRPEVEATGGGGNSFAKGRAQDFGRENPELLELIERLDDLVFDAIGGQPEALARLVEFWPDVLARLEPEILSEAREQYLRHALGVWTHSNPDGVQDPRQAIAALDVLCLLFPEADFA